MRADRLLSILLLLQLYQRMTAGELAKRLEVSERTIYRDMDALSASDVPVIAERGTGGGWELLDTYQTNLTGLNEAEIKTLFLPRPAHMLSDLGLQQASEGALIKLLAALPTSNRREAEYFRQRIHVDGAPWHPHSTEENSSAFPLLQEAIWQERKLFLTYRRSDGASFERLVDPLGLVAKGSVWYLVAAVDGEPRTYRVSRVETARLTDQPALRPPAFDLADYWERSSAAFMVNLPSYLATLRADPVILPRLRYAGRYAHIEQSDPPDDQGRITLHMRFDTQDVAREYALGFGPAIEVLEPPELRAQVLETARRIVEFYSQN